MSSSLSSLSKAAVLVAIIGPWLASAVLSSVDPDGGVRDKLLPDEDGRFEVDDILKSKMDAIQPRTLTNLDVNYRKVDLGEIGKDEIGKDNLYSRIAHVLCSFRKIHETGKDEVDEGEIGKDEIDEGEIGKDEIGKGEQGTVFKCLRSDGAIVAVKTLTWSSEFALQQICFMRDYAGQGQYVGVPGLLDLVASDRGYHIVMPLFEGKSLTAVAKEAAFDEGRLMRILFKIVVVLARMHDNGFVHVDVKPDNILCNEYDDVAVIDCGGVPMPVEMRTTLGLNFLCEILAPEFHPDWKVGFVTDIYQLGVTCDMVLESAPQDIRDSLDRLSGLRNLAICKYWQRRPNARQLLQDKVFITERAEFGLGESDDPVSEPWFSEIVALKHPQNVVNFQPPLWDPDCAQPEEDAAFALLASDTLPDAEGGTTVCDGAESSTSDAGAAQGALTRRRRGLRRFAMCCGMLSGGET